MSVITILLYILYFLGTFFLITFIREFLLFKKRFPLESEGNPLIFMSASVIINFLDTLGIGSFATGTSFFRAFKLVEDKKIPMTLNTAFTIPIMIQAVLFLKVIEIDPVTLILMIGAAVLGSIFGAMWVIKLPENLIRRYMAFSLMFVAVLILINKLGLISSGGTALGLTGWRLVVGVVGNFVLGILMTIGIGLYAPCLALVYALGMNPLAAFPIMMGSCAMLMPLASYQFVKAGVYHRKATLWSIIGGSIGVFVAVTFVKTIPIQLLLWIVLGVITYTAISLYKDSLSKTPLR